MKLVLKIVCFHSRMRRGEVSLTGTEGGGNSSFVYFCHESLAVMGVNTVRPSGKGVLAARIVSVPKV